MEPPAIMNTPLQDSNLTPAELQRLKQTVKELAESPVMNKVHSEWFIQTSWKNVALCYVLRFCLDVFLSYVCIFTMYQLEEIIQCTIVPIEHHLRLFVFVSYAMFMLTVSTSVEFDQMLRYFIMYRRSVQTNDDHLRLYQIDTQSENNWVPCKNTTYNLSRLPNVTLSSFSELANIKNLTKFEYRELPIAHVLSCLVLDSLSSIYHRGLNFGGGAIVLYLASVNIDTRLPTVALRSLAMALPFAIVMFMNGQCTLRRFCQCYFQSLCLWLVILYIVDNFAYDVLNFVYFTYNLSWIVTICQCFAHCVTKFALSIISFWAMMNFIFQQIIVYGAEVRDICSHLMTG